MVFLVEVVIRLGIHCLNSKLPEDSFPNASPVVAFTIPFVTLQEAFCTISSPSPTHLSIFLTYLQTHSVYT